MPLVQVKVIKGVFDSSQKQDMISQLTETMVNIEGEALRGVTWVTIDEVESGDWGIGGNAITAQYVKDFKRRLRSPGSLTHHGVGSRNCSWPDTVMNPRGPLTWGFGARMPDLGQF